MPKYILVISPSIIKSKFYFSQLRVSMLKIYFHARNELEIQK